MKKHASEFRDLESATVGMIKRGAATAKNSQHSICQEGFHFPRADLDSNDLK